MEQGWPTGPDSVCCDRCLPSHKIDIEATVASPHATIKKKQYKHIIDTKLAPTSKGISLRTLHKRRHNSQRDIADITGILWLLLNMLYYQRTTKVGCTCPARLCIFYTEDKDVGYWFKKYRYGRTDGRLTGPCYDSTIFVNSLLFSYSTHINFDVALF